MAATSLTFYMDESGFTGENLMSRDQPIFVQCSTTIPDVECRELLTKFFPVSRALELKHSKLAKRHKGREQICALIGELQRYAKSSVSTWLVHKEFLLLTYLIDLWVEWAAYSDGLDLYKDGAALAMSNMAFFCLRTFQSPEFLREHLIHFQKMMMERSLGSYRHFWGGLKKDFIRVDGRTRDILVPFLYSEQKLGFEHLTGLKKRSIDPAFSGIVFTCAHWRKDTSLPLHLVHDEASNIAKDRDIWDLVSSPDINAATVGIPGREMKLPLNVSTTIFGNSKTYVQLQLCDIIAGASAAWARQFTDVAYDADYCQKLDAAGIENCKIGAIWPEPKVTPDELGMRGYSGKNVDVLTKEIVRLKTRTEPHPK